jgi:hypothetical protein
MNFSYPFSFDRGPPRLLIWRVDPILTVSLRLLSSLATHRSIVDLLLSWEQQTSKKQDTV